MDDTARSILGAIALMPNGSSYLFGALGGWAWGVTSLTSDLSVLPSVMLLARPLCGVPCFNFPSPMPVMLSGFLGLHFYGREDGVIYLRQRFSHNDRSELPVHLRAAIAY